MTGTENATRVQAHDIVDVPFRPPLDGPAQRTIVLHLPFPPSVNALYANKPGKGRVRSQRYREWANVAGWALKEQRPGGIKGKVHLHLTFEDKSDRLRDVSNLVKSTEDLLVTYGVIEGDNQKVVRRITLDWSRLITGCRVCITPAPQGNES